ncbi:hypothetical protein AB0L40_14790 [Patulibacter sp. NPDC049589]|uniref:hypothetical protein n=1 Tax=Patulibacter sp. NPDC049589 TaxID=3154731 RepID=UPI00341654BB
MRRPRPVLRLLVAAVALALAGPSAATARTLEFGSTLQNAPNVAAGCESRPWVSTTDFDTYVPTASGAAGCTWWQTGVFGDQADPRKSYVPGDGTVVSVTIRSGPNPAPLRVVVARQLTPFGPKAPFSGTSCCVFAGQSEELRPAPNTTTTFPLSLAVEQNRNLESGIQTDDIVGISATSGTGTLPLFAIPGQTRQSAFTQVGTLDAAALWPALGSQANDTGGGRSPTGLAGFEVTARFTWCDGRATRQKATPRQTACAPPAGGGGGTGGGGPAGGTGGGTTGGVADPAPVALKVAAPRQTLRDLRRTGAIRARCTLDVAGACATVATVDRATAKRLRLKLGRKATTATVGSGRATLKAAGTRTVSVRLTRAARKALRSARGTVRIRLSTTATAKNRRDRTTALGVRVRP